MVTVGVHVREDAAPRRDACSLARVSPGVPVVLLPDAPITLAQALDARRRYRR
jgi:hypothetical protein